MKADLHSWEFLGISRNSQKAGNSFHKGSENVSICLCHVKNIFLIGISLPIFIDYETFIQDPMT